MRGKRIIKAQHFCNKVSGTGKVALEESCNESLDGAEQLSDSVVLIISNLKLNHFCVDEEANPS